MYLVPIETNRSMLFIVCKSIFLRARRGDGFGKNVFATSPAIYALTFPVSHEPFTRWDVVTNCIVCLQNKYLYQSWYFAFTQSFKKLKMKKIWWRCMFKQFLNYASDILFSYMYNLYLNIRMIFFLILEILYYLPT